MNKIQLRRYEMMIRVRDFGANRATDFPAGTQAATLFNKLNTTVTELGNYAASKNASRGIAKQATRRKDVLKESLQELLKTITRTARTIAADHPGLENRFQLPSGLGGRDLLAAAQGMLAHVEPLRADFVGYGIRPDFVEQLRTLTAEFETSLGERSAAAETATATITAIDRMVSEGMETVRRLDVAVRNTLSNDPDAASAWNRASHVEKADKRTGESRVQPTAKASAPVVAAGASA